MTPNSKNKRHARAHRIAGRVTDDFEGRRFWIAAIALAALVAAIYVPTLQHGFVHYDDDDYILNNHHVQAGLSLATLRWSFMSIYASNWHPLTWLSHSLDYQWFGLDATGHHAISVMLHALSALLLFYLLWTSTNRLGSSWLVSALWAVHPLAVESVSWVAERKSVLSMFLFLLALVAYARFAHKPSGARFSVVALLFALGLAAKPMIITLPAVLLLYDFWPLRRISGWTQSRPGSDIPQISLRRAVLEKTPLFILSVASAVVTIVAQHRGGALQAFDAYPLSARLENAVWAYVFYLKQLLLPLKLAAFYPHPGTSLGVLRIGAALLFLVLVMLLAWRSCQSKPYLLWGWLWFLGTLVPMLGIIQVGVQAAADRYTYLPIVGLLVAVVWLVADATHKWKSGPRYALAAIPLCALAILTVRQESYWESESQLWTHAIAVTGPNSIAERNLGAELVSLGEVDAAFSHFQRTIQLNPRDAAAHADIGTTLLARGELAPAIRELLTAVNLPAGAKEKSVEYRNLAVASARAGDVVQARESYRRAMQIDPEGFQTFVADYQHSIESRPSGDGYLWLAILLGQIGEQRASEQAWQKAVGMKPELLSAQKLVVELAQHQH